MAVAHDDAMGMTSGASAPSRYDVAVVEPEPRYRMRLGTQLAGAAQFESIEELVQHLRPGRPVVAVFGPSVAVPLGFQQVQRLVAAYPELGAVFAVAELSAPVLQAALRAGARDTVAAGDAATMVQAVARVGDLLSESTTSRVPAVPESRANPGRLTVVFSTKGGVGKSTIAINVAVAMAHRTGERVALVDADLHFGDVAVMLGIPPQTTITDAAASIQFAEPEMLSQMLTRHESGVYVLPAPAEAVLGTSLPPEELVGVCTALQSFCGHVIVDTPTVFDDSILALLEAADDILLVGGMDIPSVKNLKIGMQALDLAAIAGPKLRLVLNRANTQVKLDVREIEQVLGMRAEFPIPSDIAVPMSVNAGRPVVDADAKSPAGRAMEHIAVALLGADATAPSKKRFGRKQK
jgi:pilus assembly protein CpaE